MHARPAIVLALFLATSACTITPPASAPLGDFATLPASVDQQLLVADAVKQLQTLYPAASVRLSLHPATDTGIGAALAGALRGAGYALQEVSQPSDASKAGKGTDAEVAAPQVATAEVPVRYLLDRTGQPDAYYFTLDAGRHRLSRAYVLQQGALHPAGAWLRGELP